MTQLPPCRPTRIFPGTVLDLDGTVYLGDALLPGAKHAIETLRTAGSRVVFLSNKPLETRADYAAKLTRLSIPTSPDEVINSSWVLARWLEREAPRAILFVVGELPLLEELRAAGFRLSERAGEIQFVVASFDRTFDYHKLQIAFDAINAGARFIATNADRYCPTPPRGGGLPDAAAVIGAIEGCTGKSVEVVVGKPRLSLPAPSSTACSFHPPSASSSATGWRRTCAWARRPAWRPESSSPASPHPNCWPLPTSGPTMCSAVSTNCCRFDFSPPPLYPYCPTVGL